MKRKRLVLFLSLMIILILIVIALAVFNTDIDIAVQEWKYKQSGEPEDLIVLCVKLSAAEKDRLLNQYLPEVLQIEDFDGQSKNIVPENLEFADPAMDSEELYTYFLAEYLFSYLYVENYDEYLDVFPVLFEELLQREWGDLEWFSRAGQTERIKPDGYWAILQSLEAYCPEQPEPIGENFDAINEYLKIRTMLSAAYLYLGDTEESEAIEADNQRVTDELLKNMT